MVSLRRYPAFPTLEGVRVELNLSNKHVAGQIAAGQIPRDYATHEIYVRRPGDRQLRELARLSVVKNTQLLLHTLFLDIEGMEIVLLGSEEDFNFGTPLAWWYPERDFDIFERLGGNSILDIQKYCNLLAFDYKKSEDIATVVEFRNEFRVLASRTVLLQRELRSEISKRARAVGRWVQRERKIKRDELSSSDGESNGQAVGRWVQEQEEQKRKPEDVD